MKNEVTMTKKDKYLLYGMAAGLAVMLILRDINGISVSKYLYLAYVVGFMAIANYQTLVNIICFILPLVCGLPGTYIMPCALVLLTVKRGRMKATQLVPILLILLLELVAALWYPKIDFALIVNYVSFAAVMIFLTQDDSVVDYNRCMQAYLLGTVLLCYVILSTSFADAPTRWMRYFAEGQFRIGDQHIDTGAMTLKLNANSLAYYSLVGVGCSFLMLERVKGIGKIWYVATIVLFVVAGFLTLSRSWLLLMTLCLLLYIAGKLRNPKHIFVLLLVVVVIVSVVINIFNKNPELLTGFETRFEDETMETGGGRSLIFKRYMDVFFSDFRFILTGTGVTQLTAATGMIANMHNGTQQILVCGGIVGFALYMVVLIGPAIKASRGKRIRLIYWLPLFCVVAFTQTIQFLNPTMLMLPYIIGIYALKAGGRNDENLSDNGGHRGRQSVALEAR